MHENPRPPRRVFISYTWDSPEHVQAAIQLAQGLRRRGLDCVIDQFKTAPPEGWPRWVLGQVKAAEWVVVLLSPIYRAVLEDSGGPCASKGSRWESMLMLHDIYDRGSLNPKFIPAYFEESYYHGDVPPRAAGTTWIEHCVPSILRPFSLYGLPGADEQLYRLLTDQPLVRPEPIGAIEVLGERSICNNRSMRPASVADLPPRVFFGRQSELEQLRAGVLDQDCRIAVLGSPGIGKSTLVRAI